MPPPRNEQDVRRITKQLAHPRDRKVRQLEKRQARADRVSAQEMKRRQEQERMLLRFVWFREQCVALGHGTTAVPRDWWLPLVRLFIGRNDDEVAALKAARNPPEGRIRLLERMREEELRELRSAKGFAIPALGADEEVEILTEVWDGLLETSVVLEKAYVVTTDERERGGAAAADDAVARELAAKLKPIDAVRAAVEAVLPRRATVLLADDAKRRGGGAKREGRTQQQRRRQTSVKQMAAASGAEARARVKETAHRKQQAHLKKHRNAMLEARRNH